MKANTEADGAGTGEGKNRCTTGLDGGVKDIFGGEIELEVF